MGELAAMSMRKSQRSTATTFENISKEDAEEDEEDEEDDDYQDSDQADEEEVAAVGKAKEIGIDKTEVSDINQDAKKVSFGGRGRGAGVVKKKSKSLKPKQPKVDEGKIDDLWASMMEESKPKPKPKPKPEAAATSLTAAAPARTGTKRPVSDLDALMGLDSEPVKKKPGLDASAIARLKQMTQDPMAHKDNLVKIQEKRDFAGQDINVVREMKEGSAEHKEWLKTQPKTGLDALLADLQPKKQMNTLTKTSLDWDKHKKENKLDDELDEHNRNGGYLEKQDFLDRSSHRQFKLEQAHNRKRLGVSIDD